MSHSLRGEMTEMVLPVFSHPAGNLDSAVARLTRADSALTALGYAIRNGDLRTVREILDGDGDDVTLLHKSDYAGNTAVHLAAVGPNPDVLRELLTKGASLHTRNRANNTPLFLAETTGRDENASLLREAGAHRWKD
jgi:lysophospholipase